MGKGVEISGGRYVSVNVHRTLTISETKVLVKELNAAVSRIVREA